MSALMSLRQLFSTGQRSVHLSLIPRRLNVAMLNSATLPSTILVTDFLFRRPLLKSLLKPDRVIPNANNARPGIVKNDRFSAVVGV